MSKLVTGASMSLDGYIAGPNESGFEYLFKWLSNGDVVVQTANPDIPIRTTPTNAEHFRRLLEETGSLLVGRRLFDLTNAWGGQHPHGVPVVVVTHSVPEGWPREDADFTFVTDGIQSAADTARDLAGGKNVGVNGGTIARQCLDAGLLDEIGVDLVPVLLGGGVPFFSQLEKVPVELEGPISVVEGEDVLHLRYRVKKT